MTLKEVLDLVCELAHDNVINDPDMQEEHDRQVQALEIVNAHMETL